MKKEYQVNSWAGFLSLCGAPLTHHSLRALTPQEYRDGGGKSKENYEKYLILQLIIKGYNEKYIGDQLHLGVVAIQRRINHWWGSFHGARKQFVGPILALCLKKGWSVDHICTNVPFFQKVFPEAKNFDTVNHYSLLWFGITIGAAKNFLVTNSLHWFLTTYL